MARKQDLPEYVLESKPWMPEKHAVIKYDRKFSKASQLYHIDMSY